MKIAPKTPQKKRVILLMKAFREMKEPTRENMKDIPGASKKGQGVYILYERSMPVYVGKGNIKQRIREHKRSPRMSKFWDEFSWYIPKNKDLTHDLEAVLQCMLPDYPHRLTRQKAKLKVKPKKPSAGAS